MVQGKILQDLKTNHKPTMQLFIKLHALKCYYSVHLNTALVIYKAQNNLPPNCIQRLNQIGVTIVE